MVPANVYLLLLAMGGMTSSMVWPLRHRPLPSVLLGVGLFCVMVVGDWMLGNVPQWVAYQLKQAQFAKTSALLASFKTADDVIHALESRLDHTKHSAKGWEILAKLYAHQGRHEEAEAAFAEARRLSV